MGSQQGDAPDVAALRRGAHERAAARPRRPFAGAVTDLAHDGVALRRYTPDRRRPGAAAVFLHGGYGLFGDLELQDGWCRRAAAALGVAVLAARRTARPLAGLLLTNPNLDLTLESYDDTLPGGPGRELSAYAMRAWTGVEPAGAPRLHRSAAGLPPTLLAVGVLDSLLPEARALADACGRDGVPCRLVELPGAEHGLVGTDRAGEVLVEAAAFLGLG